MNWAMKMLKKFCHTNTSKWVADCLLTSLTKSAMGLSSQSLSYSVYFEIAVNQNGISTDPHISQDMPTAPFNPREAQHLESHGIFPMTTEL